MKKARIELIILALLLIVGALIALSREEAPENILPAEGLLLCEIEGEPYYYNEEYLFKITASVFPAEPTVEEKQLALYYELAYREMVGGGTFVSVDRVENEIKERRGIEKAAEKVLGDADAEASQILYYEEYMAMLTACAEKEGTSTTVFWDDITPYVEKGLIVEMYLGTPFHGFDAGVTIDKTDYDTLLKKYDVIFVEESMQ